jgi:FkbM family methyltransferase
MAIFLHSLKKYGHLDNLKMTIGQIGSRKLSPEDDYGSQGWDIFGKNLTIYGFDADADATEAANFDIEVRQVPWQEIHVPIGLSSREGEATLYVTKDPMCTSLYPPNEPYLDRFSNLSDLMGLDFEIEIETTTLDAFCAVEGVEDIDFLKIDVQGADLDVLKGATDLLSHSVVAIQIEVEFSHLYHDQPLFADVDIYLRNQGFTFFNLEVASRPRNISPIPSNRGLGQILWGDAVYIRDLIPENMNQQLRTPQQMLKLACIADSLGFPDYTVEILTHLTANYGHETRYNCANAITDGLYQFPSLVEKGLDSLPVIKQIKAYLSDEVRNRLAV